MKWDVVIGLEIHAQLNTESKMFCTCATSFADEPNKNTCPTCLGFPGALPVPNIKAVEKGILTAHALNCKIANFMRFDRKNYFYPDSPKAYQITQFFHPIGTTGSVNIDVKDGDNTYTKTIGISEMHLEDDAGKLIHMHGTNKSYVDLNRSGTPLVEIVSTPDLNSSLEAVTYFKKIKSILEYIGASNCNMEQGDLRCDANVSIKPAGSTTLGNRTEIKNMNTFKGLQAAIDYEIKRQKKILEAGEVVISQTMTYDPVAQKTNPLREKVDASGYRYYPEADIPVFSLKADYVKSITSKLPELPEEKKIRFIASYGLSDYDATTLVADKKTADFYEASVKLYPEEPKKICNWINGDLQSYLNEKLLQIDAVSVTPKHIAELVKLIVVGDITGKIGKDIFPTMLETGKLPSIIVSEKGLKTMSDSGELESIIDKVIAGNPNIVEQYRSGQDKVFGFFVGQVMKETKGQANPATVNELLKKKLSV